MLLISACEVLHTTTSSCLSIALNSAIRHLESHIHQPNVADALGPVIVLEYAAALVKNYQRLAFRSFALDDLVLTHDFWNPGQAKRRVDGLLNPSWRIPCQHAS